MVRDLRQVNPHELPVWWPLLRDRLAAACERSSGKYLPADILQCAIAGRMQLWVALSEKESEASEADTNRLRLQPRAPGANAVSAFRRMRARGLQGASPPAQEDSGPSDVAGAIAQRDSPTSRPASEGPQIEAIAITEIVDFPRRKICRLLACTGTGADRWLDKLAEIEDWARHRGCTAIEPVARPGWERKLTARGYRKTHVVLEKSLNAENAT